MRGFGRIVGDRKFDEPSPVTSGLPVNRPECQEKARRHARLRMFYCPNEVIGSGQPAEIVTDDEKGCFVIATRQTVPLWLRCAVGQQYRRVVAEHGIADR